MKIVLGDKSDNIAPVFERCGPKTVSKYFHNPKLFQAKLNENKEAQARFKHNTQLIDFNNIPKDLADEFYQSIENIL